MRHRGRRKYPIAKSYDGKAFGTELRRLRRGAGLSQSAFAKAVEVAQGYISRIETGSPYARPSRELVADFAKILGDAAKLEALAGHVPALVEDAYNGAPNALQWFARWSIQRRSRQTSARPTKATPVLSVRLPGIILIWVNEILTELERDGTKLPQIKRNRHALLLAALDRGLEEILTSLRSAEPVDSVEPT